MTGKPRTFLPIAARLRHGVPIVMHGYGGHGSFQAGSFRAVIHEEQAAEAIETLYDALNYVTMMWDAGGVTLDSMANARAALEKVRTMGEAPRSKKEAV